MKSIYTLLVSLILLALAVSVFAGPIDGAVVDPTRVPINITSEKMIYDEGKRTVVFEKDVVAKHGDLTLWAEKLTAYLVTKSGKEGTPDSIDYIIATGNVRALKGNSEGTCGKLTYYVAKQFLKMEQGPKLKDGPNSLSGKVINFYAAENRSEVIGGKGERVKAIFLAPGETKDKK